MLGEGTLVVTGYIPAAYPPPRDFIFCPDRHKGCEKHKDRDEEGECCETTRVGNLQFGLAVPKLDRAVADEVLKASQFIFSGPRQDQVLLTIHLLHVESVVSL